jgi:hypothetical protein
VITPNLATRPFLNTRPVWLVAAAAGLLALILISFNLRLYLVANRHLDDETTMRDGLELRYNALATEVKADVDVLERVPWKSLEGRVDATNLILREHSFSWIEMLDDIERVMPYDLRLTRITPSVGSDVVTLSLVAVARNRDVMLEFLDNMIADPRFEDPTPSSEKTPEETELTTYLLTMRVTYRPSEETP